MAKLLPGDTGSTRRYFFYVTAIWIAALVLSVFTYLQPGTHLWPGLDQAWAYGINYAFDKRLMMGRDIIFTFGPLGFLEHTRVVSVSMLYLSTVFAVLVSLVVNASLLHFSWQVSKAKAERTLNMLVCIVLILLLFPEMQRLLVLGYALVFLHWVTRRDIYLLLLTCSIPFCVFIKFSYGAAVLSLWFSYLALLYYNERKLKTILFAVSCLVISYAGLWRAIYGTLSGAIGYLEGELYISRGNASAMAMNPENNWPAITGFYIAVMLAAICLHKSNARRYTLLPLIFAAPLFVWTKYTFAQEQALHFVPILDFAVFVLLIFFIAASGWLQKIMILLLLPCAIFAWKMMHTSSVGTPDYDNVPQITLSLPDKGLVKNPRRHIDYLFNVWRTGEKERLVPLRLPADMRAVIGNASVDVYPWELGIAPANNLNWHPRPAFQTYIAYLPFLDGKNSDFYSGSNAPDYIVWHHHDFQDVMQRYSLSSEPMTMESLLRHYQRVSCEGIFCLWKRSDHEQLRQPVDIKNESVKWDEWVKLPANAGDILRAKLVAKRSVAGNLNLLAWKEGGIAIDYKLQSGVIKTHDLLIDNAVSGVWISPYFEQYLGDNTASRIEELSLQKQKTILAQAPAQGYMEKVEPTVTGGGRMVGWATIPSIDSREQQQYILLMNTRQSFLVYADKFNRSDVIDYFNKQGQSNSGQCGFYQEVTAHQIPDGDYQVRFAVKVGERWAAVPDQGLVLHMDASMNKNQVSEVRFRTSRPWAFAETITIQWQELKFTESVPW